MAGVGDGLDRLDPQLQQPSDTHDTYLLRFLRARSFNPKAAHSLLEDDLKWRLDPTLGDLGCSLQELTRMADGCAVMECTREDFTVVQQHFPMLMAGHDHQGRPVLYKKLGGNCVVSEVVKRVPAKQLVKYHLWTQEKAIAAAADRSTATKRHIERVVCIIDAKDWYVSLFSSAAREYLRGIADMDSAHYPERLGGVVVVNAPLLLSTAWAVIRLWLDERTNSKVQILRGPDVYEPILREMIPEDQLLEEYGGTFKAEFNTGIFAACDSEQNAQ